MKRLVAMAAAAAGMALATAAMTTGIDVAEGVNTIPCPAKAVAAVAVSTNAAASVKLSRVTPLYVGGRLVKAWTNTVWEAALYGGISTNSIEACRFMPGDVLLCETTNAAPWRATIVLEN